MIEIRTVQGRTWCTKRHTLAQAQAAVDAGVPMLIGGPGDDLFSPQPELTVQPQDVKDIREVQG
jgi:hypothetical protein